MTIAERQAREAYDREHPWRHISTFTEDMFGMICELRLSYDREHPWRHISTFTEDMFGMICELRLSYQGMATDQGHRRFFRTNDGWYQIEPPEELWRYAPIIEWRPTGTRLAEHRQRSVIRRAEYGTHEYRGGRLYRKPKSYKLYWRADD
ncbi:hypothetical protein ASD50_20640 [Mesorhizobium sp. Root552]|uniref:hypothetical protein n=1 Tax=Mesorhizobium sp. Root552 TaxID=1736555 RepID=UPI0006F2DBF1|nr:hypothetical protein [Mesorhizobium sp. Root552]KQZ25834.1 hypothetical protein ASD50_20640 [Mesorhizobium sp. Root552]